MFNGKDRERQGVEVDIQVGKKTGHVWRMVRKNGIDGWGTIRICGTAEQFDVCEWQIRGSCGTR